MAQGSSTQTVMLVDQWGNPFDSDPIGGSFALKIADPRSRRLLEAILVELQILNAYFLSSAPLGVSASSRPARENDGEANAVVA